jgi:hypothetical protein
MLSLLSQATRFSRAVAAAILRNFQEKLMDQVTSSRMPKNLSRSVNDLIAEGGRTLASDDEGIVKKRNWKADIAHLAPDVRVRLMDKYCIAYNGRHYEAAGYRYDSLADAVVYAKLGRSLGGNEIGQMQHPENVEAPTASQRRLMTELCITYQDGIYRLGAYRYERLHDALDYVRLKRQVPVEPQTSPLPERNATRTYLE